MAILSHPIASNWSSRRVLHGMHFMIDCVLGFGHLNPSNVCGNFTCRHRISWRRCCTRRKGDIGAGEKYALGLSNILRWLFEEWGWIRITNFMHEIEHTGETLISTENPVPEKNNQKTPISSPIMPSVIVDILNLYLLTMVHNRHSSRQVRNERVLIRTLLPRVRATTRTRNEEE